jgi:hypothetical protein
MIWKKTLKREPVAPYMTRADFKSRIKRLVELELAGTPGDEWYDVQIALRRDLDAHGLVRLFDSIEGFVWCYCSDYDVRLKDPEYRDTHLRGIKEWLDEYDTSEG